MKMLTNKARVVRAAHPASKYMAEPPVQGRDCGGCTACCVLPRIQDRPGLTSLPLLPQGKPGYAPCQHLEDGQRKQVYFNGEHVGDTLPMPGCSRYDDRPQVCRDFECLWRAGLIAGDARRRPDQLGLMFTLEENGGKFDIEAWELWEGAAVNHPGRGIIEAIHEATGKVTVRYYGVPCSVHLSAMRPEAGTVLSRMAREQPEKLASWLRAHVAVGNFADGPDDAATLDVASLERGEPVVAHFQPR